jgi:regulatory factor X
MYMHPSVAHIDPISIQQHHHHSQASNAPPAAYGRAMSADHNLEQLASNVRSATTTSASDRAKQIFVHAW